MHCDCLFNGETLGTVDAVTSNLEQKARAQILSMSTARKGTGTKNRN